MVNEQPSIFFKTVILIAHLQMIMEILFQLLTLNKPATMGRFVDRVEINLDLNTDQ
jgi:hypothetical protein